MEGTGRRLAQGRTTPCGLGPGSLPGQGDLNVFKSALTKHIVSPTRGADPRTCIDERYGPLEDAHQNMMLQVDERLLAPYGRSCSLHNQRKSINSQPAWSALLLKTEAMLNSDCFVHFMWPHCASQ